MEIVTLGDKIAEATKQGAGFVRLFGTENFRCWLLCYEKGEGTDMHYHVEPETMMVIQGRASVKDKSGCEKIVEKNQVVILGAKEFYQITSVSDELLVLFANRPEKFSGSHVTAE